MVVGAEVDRMRPTSSSDLCEPDLPFRVEPLELPPSAPWARPGLSKFRGWGYRRDRRRIYRRVEVKRPFCLICSEIGALLCSEAKRSKQVKSCQTRCEISSSTYIAMSERAGCLGHARIPVRLTAQTWDLAAPRIAEDVLLAASPWE